MNRRLVVLLQLAAVGGILADSPLEHVVGLVGDDVTLPCRVDVSNCGEFHTVKWYKESKRVFVFSDLANLMKSEGPLVDRSEFKFNSSSSHSGLLIKAVGIADEGSYRCEVTYLDVKDNCDIVQAINFTTMSLPDYVTIAFEEEVGSEIPNITALGPLPEGTSVTMICRSGGGRPLPALGWWNGTDRLPGAFSATVDDQGSEVAVSRLEVALSRNDLGAAWECKAEAPLMDFSVSAHVTVDVHVRPVSVNIEGPDGSVVEGSLVNILCLIQGARPAATVSWKNNTDGKIVVPQHDSEHLSTDQTFETQSRLSLKVSREDNGRVLTCEAANQVMLDKGESPIKTSLTLQVLYAPTVRVTPDNITVNESMDFLIFCSHESNPLTLVDVNWYKDGERLQLHPDRYEGANVDSPSLLVKKATRDDSGSYTCRLTNSVGTGESEDIAFVSVQYSPEVELRMEPIEAVKEADRPNITLTCEVLSGHPGTLLGVRWYLDGDLLKELPECSVNDTSYVYVDEEFCDVDPSKLLLENVGRSFQGNYSCEGMNSAGWGTRSEEQELVIHYTPGKASILVYPPIVVKDSDVTLTCIVDNFGRPAANQYRWFQNGHLVHDVTTANWTITPVTLKTEANVSCYAVNIAGPGEADTIEIDVLAPPAFIDRLPPYQGALVNSSDIAISCRVECAPLCEILWFKDGVPIEDDSPYYEVATRFLPPEPRSNDFDSIVSTLNWNMTQWPGGQLDRLHDNSNYTCTSTGNSVGSGVSSTTHFRVEYPPENITISQYRVKIPEGGIPEKLRCQAKAYPEATYFWTFQNETISTGEILFLDYPVNRDKAGDYSCVAQNRHGNISVSSFINVLFKPECSITQREIEGHTRLICDVVANPRDITFTWLFRNETINDGVTSRGLQSVVTLDHGVSPLGTYICYARNDEGVSVQPCEIDVTGMSGLIENIGDENMIIIIAIVAASVVMVILVCLIIICCCRRKKGDDKYSKSGKPKGLEERENGEYQRFVVNIYGNSLKRSPDGVSSMSTSSHVQTSHKWPVKPGVHVHVNGLHTLGTASSVNGFTYGAGSSSDSGSEKGSKKLPRPVASSSPLILSAQDLHISHEVNKTSRGSVSVRKSKRNPRNSQVLLMRNSDPLDADMSAESLNRTDDSCNTLSRKRKKPGTLPLGTGNGSAEIGSEDHRSFYENLPFHNMAQPPNKPLLPIGNDVEYADVDFSTYGPIEYKKASILAAQQRKDKYNPVPPRPPKESAF